MNCCKLILFPNQIRKRLLVLSALASPLVINQFGYAQSRDDGIVTNWYQVEVIMFTQGNNWATATELWPTDIRLQYPGDWQASIPPEEILEQEDATDLDSLGAGQDTDSNNAEEESTETTATDVQDNQYLDPEQIYMVAKEELALTSIAQRINRGRRRILFHGAWHQYMERDIEEAPLIFTAGDKYDDHYELEGSIHVYRQRLLHFDVNLWFTEFSINAGQERLPWPEIPLRPSRQLPTRSLIELDQPTNLNQPTTSTGQGVTTSVFNNDTLNTDLNTGLLNNNNSGGINILDWYEQRGNTTFYDTRYDEILSRNYVVNNLALIQQDRPMRSDELHYIDHPLVGILVKIDYYYPPIFDELEDDPLEELLGPRPE